MTASISNTHMIGIYGIGFESFVLLNNLLSGWVLPITWNFNTFISFEHLYATVFVYSVSIQMYIDCIENSKYIYRSINMIVCVFVYVIRITLNGFFCIIFSVGLFALNIPLISIVGFSFSWRVCSSMLMHKVRLINRLITFFVVVLIE